MTYLAGNDTIEHLTQLVWAERPEWDATVLRIVLTDLSMQGRVNGNDLAIAALRAASNRDLPSPKAIGWRGPHWRDLDTVPPSMTAPVRCDVCGRPEPDCYGVRPGPDDHQFVPAR